MYLVLRPPPVFNVPCPQVTPTFKYASSPGHSHFLMCLVPRPLPVFNATHNIKNWGVAWGRGYPSCVSMHHMSIMYRKNIHFFSCTQVQSYVHRATKHVHIVLIVHKIILYCFFPRSQSYIMFGEREDLEMFKEIYGSIMKYLKRG